MSETITVTWFTRPGCTSVSLSGREMTVTFTEATPADFREDLLRRMKIEFAKHKADQETGCAVRAWLNGEIDRRLEDGSLYETGIGWVWDPHLEFL